MTVTFPKDTGTVWPGGDDRTRDRALIQMAKGSGKTFTAIHAIYRLIKFGKARRVETSVKEALVRASRLRQAALKGQPLRLSRLWLS